MNSKSFFQALRQVIREEVQTVVREELRNVLTENTHTAPIVKPRPVVKPVNENTRLSKPKKTYSTNPMLNDILNDVGGFSASGPRVALDESMEFASMHNDFSEWPSIDTGKMSAHRAPTVLRDINGSAIPVEALSQTEEGAAVINALTKDYSALMKAIDKKKGL